MEAIVPRHLPDGVPGGGTMLVPNAAGVVTGAANLEAANELVAFEQLSKLSELSERSRRRLPDTVQQKLLGLDGTTYKAALEHETLEHHVTVMPTSFSPAFLRQEGETFQFTATSHYLGHFLN